MSKSTKKIPNHWKIDSLRLEIPKKYVDVSTRFTDEYKLLNVTTGEHEELQQFQKKEMLEHDINGVKFYTRIYPRARKTEEGKFSKDMDLWLQVLLSSKMLGSDYWEGITDSTILSLYNKIMSIGHFRCTYEVFLNSVVFDVDYCKDYTADRGQFNDYCKEKPFIPLSYKIFAKKNGDISTLQFNFREKGTFQRPYFKIYNKLDEYKSRTRFEKLNTFYKFYNLSIPENNHFRKEITINSLKGFKSITSSVLYRNTLNDALRLISDDKGMADVLDQLNVYKVKKIIQPKEFKSIPLLISFIVDLERSLGLSKDEIENKYDSLFRDANFHRNTLSNLKKELAQQIDIYDMAQTEFAINMSQSEFDEMNDLCFGL